MSPVVWPEMVTTPLGMLARDGHPPPAVGSEDAYIHASYCMLKDFFSTYSIHHFETLQYDM